MTADEYLSQFTPIKSFKDTGQKRVFLVRPNEGGGPVIMKIGKSSSPALFKRAEREVEVQRSLDSDYYPKNINFFLFDDNQFVIVEEYIESEALSNCFGRFTEPLYILILLRHLISGLDLIWESRMMNS